MQHYVFCNSIKLDELDSIAPILESQCSLGGDISLAVYVNKFHVLEIEIKREPMEMKFTPEEVT